LEELEERLLSMNDYEEDEAYDIASPDVLESRNPAQNNDLSKIKPDVDALLTAQDLRYFEWSVVRSNRELLRNGRQVDPESFSFRITQVVRIYAQVK
jgi:hypothetical protein